MVTSELTVKSQPTKMNVVRINDTYNDNYNFNEFIKSQETIIKNYVYCQVRRVIA